MPFLFSHSFPLKAGVAPGPGPGPDPSDYSQADARFMYPLSEGDRTGLIAVSTDATITVGNGVVGNLIDGAYGNNSTDGLSWDSSQSGRVIVFDFGSPQFIAKVLWIALSTGSLVSQGVWVAEGSNDGSSYVPLSDELEVTTATSSVFPPIFDTTLYNPGSYRYLRMRQVSGTTNIAPWHREFIFQIIDPEGAADVTPTYNNFWGSGPRRGILDFTAGSSAGTLFNSTIQNLIDGIASGTQNFFIGGRTGGWMEFTFPHPVLITEATLVHSGGGTHGTWKWRGSNNGGGSYTDIGGNFTLSGSPMTELNGNTDEYSTYRLEQVSGSTSSGPWINEMTFEIGVNGPAA